MAIMIKLIRVIFFVPAMYLGALLSVPVSAISNLPILLIDWITERMGNWSLGALIFGSTKASFSEIFYVLVSGIFMSSIGLFFALSIFPYEKHRNKIIYFLFALLLIGFSSPRQFDTYGSWYLYSAKLIGIVIGFGIVLKLLLDPNTKTIFAYVDKRISPPAENLEN